MPDELCPGEGDTGDFGPVDAAMTEAFDCQCQLLAKLRDAIAEGFNKLADVLGELSRKLAGSLAAGTIEAQGQLSQLQGEIRTHAHAEFDALAGRILPFLAEIERRIGDLEGRPEGRPAERPPTAPEKPPETPKEPPPGETTPKPPTAPETDSGDSVIARPTPEEIDRFGEPLPPAGTPPLISARPVKAGIAGRCDPLAFVSQSEIDSFLRGTIPGFQTAAEAAGATSAAIREGLPGASDPIGRFLGSFITSFLNTLIGRGFGEIENLAKARGCGTGPFVSGTIFRWLIETLAQYTSPAISELAQPWIYALHRSCPSLFPTVSEADAAYFANAIDDATHRSWVEINNVCWEPHQPVLEAQRRKLIPGELLQLLLRERIDEGEFVNGLRSLGYTRPRDWQLLRQLGELIPPYTDQIRFMVRDVYDEGTVAELGMDDLFDVKFLNEPRAVKRAESLGIPVKVMQDLWRAHWALPASGQLFEMVHRLPHVSDQLIAAANEALRANKVKRTFTRPTQQEALNFATGVLIQNDVLPSVIPRLLALSFRRMRLRDISRAFQIGAMSKEELKQKFLEQGFIEADADTQVKFWQANTDEGADNDEAIKLFKAELITKDQLKARMKRRSYTPERVKEVIDDAEKTYRSGEAVKRFKDGRIPYETALQRLKGQGIDGAVASVFLDEAAELRDGHPALEDYEAGVIDRAEAVRWIGTDLRPAARVEKLLDDIDRKLESQLTKVCADNLCRRYLAGEFQEHDLRRELNGLGLSPGRVEWWIRRCNCQKKSAGKEPTAAQLCADFERGLIDPHEFGTRLLRQGWKPEDAARIIQQCALRVEAKLAKEAERQAKLVAKEAADAEKERAKRAKTARASAERLTKLREAAEKARDQREARVVIVIDKLATRDELPLAEATKMVRSAWRSLVADFPFTPNERVKILETAVDPKLWTDALPWDARWRAVAAAHLQVQGNGPG